jgi:hypothetical protein
LVFAIAGAIIINLFASANKVNQRSEAVSVALIKVESIIEEYKGFEYAVDANNFLETQGFPKLYDKDWKETTDEAQAVYSIVLLSTQKKFDPGSIFTLDITCFENKNGKELIKLQASKYFMK